MKKLTGYVFAAMPEDHCGEQFYVIRFDERVEGSLMDAKRELQRIMAGDTPDEKGTITDDGRVLAYRKLKGQPASFRHRGRLVSDLVDIQKS